MSWRTGLWALAMASMAALPLQPVFGQRGGDRLGGASGRYVSGHVAFEDGSVPNQRVVIESSCHGSIRQETTADKSGGFAFTVGKGSGDIMLDSTNQIDRAGGGTATSNAMECSILAALAGYTSDAIYLGSLETTKVDIGTIVLHKAAAGTNASATSQKAPKDAVKAFDKGKDAVKNKKWDDAVKNYQKAVELYPEYAQAWYELGTAQVESKQLDEAHKSFEASVKADDKFLPPYTALASLEAMKQNWKGLVEITDQVIRLAPNGSPQIYFYNAAGQFRLQNPDAAEKSAREGLRLDAQHAQPKLYQVLASVLAVRGDLKGAAEQLRQYLQFAPTAPDAAAMKAQIAEMESRAAVQPKQ